MAVTKVGSLCIVTGVGLLNYDHVHQGEPFLKLPLECSPEASTTFMLPIFSSEMKKTDDEGRLQPFKSSMNRAIVNVDENGNVKIDKERMAADLVDLTQDGQLSTAQNEIDESSMAKKESVAVIGLQGMVFTKYSASTRKIQLGPHWNLTSNAGGTIKVHMHQHLWPMSWPPILRVCSSLCGSVVTVVTSVSVLSLW